jgi:4Fe-4S ferredoxin
MKMGVMKHRFEKKLVLERKTLETRHVLVLDTDRCVGCGICEAICPKESPKLSSPMIRNGRLLEKPSVDFDTDKCTFCGECVDLCPTNAIRIEINDQPRLPVFEAEAFPILTKLFTIDAEKCWYGALTAECEVKCQEACPRDAIEVTLQRIGEEPTGRIVDFKVLQEACIFCKKCESACPEGAISVIKPVRGFLRIDTSLCPEGCRVCADICPSEAITTDERDKLVVAEEFCIYCGACQRVCPEEAIRVRRIQVLHTDVKSGAWVRALEKLASFESVFKEVLSKSEKKRRARVESLAGF